MYFPRLFIGRTKINLEFIADIKPGQGQIIEFEGKKVAVYKDKSGQITKLSPVCTHLGCIVHWEEQNRQWLCACHGSRFSPEGQPLGGPAKQPLEKII